ncbi:MAG: hypothetical protein KC503_16685 [Myxococcales bacterium]|nr:hypothetical protein [Myxococcales bacterium]
MSHAKLTRRLSDALVVAASIASLIVIALVIAGCGDVTIAPGCERCVDSPRRRPAPVAPVGSGGKVAADVGQALVPGQTGGGFALAAPPAPPSGTPTWLLTGRIEVELSCAAGALNSPPVYVALATRCGDWSTVYERQRVLLDVQKTQRYDFFVPDGTHHLVALLDCNGDADPLDPRPGPGDVVFTAGQKLDGLVVQAPQKPCRTYKLAGRGTIDVPVTLNAAP